MPSPLLLFSYSPNGLEGLCWILQLSLFQRLTEKSFTKIINVVYTDYITDNSIFHILYFS